MNILTIPMRNIRRKPSKTLLLLLILSLGIISIVALYEVSKVVGHNLEKKLIAFGANIIISPLTEKLSVSYGGLHMGEMLFDIQELNEEKSVQAIRSIEHKDRLSAVAPNLVTMTMVNNTAVALVGVRWDEERRIKSYWAPKGTFPEKPNEVLIGSKAAEKLQLQTGDSIPLLGKEFTVSATLYETGSDDDTVIFMNLSALQELQGKPGATSFIEVAALCSGCPIEDIVAQLQEKLPGVEVKALQQVINQRMASIHFVQKLAFGISLVILVTAAAMVGLSMMSAVSERKKDIGILRSLGYGKPQVFLIFCIEAGLIGMLAGVVGYVFGFMASFQVLKFLHLAEGGTPIFLTTHLLMTAGLFSLITVLAAVYPAWKGARVEPSTALVAL